MINQQKDLKFLKPAWAALYIVVLAFTPAKAFAQEQAENIQTMVYEVYAGGIHAVQAKLTVDLSDEDRYDLNLFAKTRGLLGKLAPWHGTFSTNGWRDEDTLQPELHKSVTTWKEEEETKEYKYNRDGSFNELVIKDYQKKPQIKKPEAELTDKSFDTLTAALMTLKAVASGEQCDQKAPVFDGKRRFNQVFNFLETEDLKQTKYNIYEGPSIKCTVEVEPDGGQWHKKPRGWLSIQEQGRERGTMPTMWIANITPDMPAVPVKIFVKTAYGNLFMHLAEYNANGKKWVAEKRVILDEES